MVEEKRNENGVFDVLNGQRGKNYKTRNASLCQRGFIKKKKKKTIIAQSISTLTPCFR